MIVKDKEKTLETARELSTLFINMLPYELSAVKLSANKIEDDPAEYIYLLMHTTAQFTRKIFNLIDGYADIYAIKDLTHEKIIEWYELILKEIV